MSSYFISGCTTGFLKNVLPIKVAGAYLRVNGGCLPDAEASDPRLRGAKDNHGGFCPLETCPFACSVAKEFSHSLPSSI